MESNPYALTIGPSKSVLKGTKWWVALFLMVTTLPSCAPELDAPDADPGNADPTRTVYMGEGFLAGYRDGSLFDKGQKKGVAELISRQFEKVGGKSVRHPMMPDYTGMGINHKPWESDFVTKSKLKVVEQCNGEEGFAPVFERFNESEAVPYLKRVEGPEKVTNLAVPFAKTRDLLDPSFGKSYSAGNDNPYYHRFASLAGVSTVLEDALERDPSFLVLWTGKENIYDYCRHGGKGKRIPPASLFAARLDTILQRFADSGVTKGLIANIPHIDDIPYYNTIPYNGAELSKSKADSLTDIYENNGVGHIEFQEGANPFIINDSTAPKGVRQMIEGERISLRIPLDSLRCKAMGVLFETIPDKYSLDSGEIRLVKQRIRAYNQVVRQKADQYGFGMVDMREFFSRVGGSITYDGKSYSAEFVRGGFFSLDGYHPTSKGNALIADRFIEVYDQRYDASLPEVHCSDCHGTLFP